MGDRGCYQCHSFDSMGFGQLCPCKHVDGRCTSPVPWPEYFSSHEEVKRGSVSSEQEQEQSEVSGSGEEDAGA